MLDFTIILAAAAVAGSALAVVLASDARQHSRQCIVFLPHQMQVVTVAERAFAVLKCIVTHGALEPGAIADLTGIDRAAVAADLEALEAKGLVQFQQIRK